MDVSLEDMKGYLRVEFEEDDELITLLIASAKKLCLEIARVEDSESLNEHENLKYAVMYAVAYLYEHREDANHKELKLTIRSLLSGIREEIF